MRGYQFPTTTSCQFPTATVRQSATRADQDLHIAGLKQRTREGYLREVRKLACHSGISPDLVSEKQLREYFLYLKNETEFAPGSLKVAFNGIKFFYTPSPPD